MLASEQGKNCKNEFQNYRMKDLEKLALAARPTTSSDYPEERPDAGTLRAKLDSLTNPPLVQILDAA